MQAGSRPSRLLLACRMLNELNVCIKTVVDASRGLPMAQMEKSCTARRKEGNSPMHPPCSVPKRFIFRGTTGSLQTTRPSETSRLCRPYRAVVSKSWVLPGSKFSWAFLTRLFKNLRACSSSGIRCAYM